MYVKKKQEAEAAESHYMVGTSEEVQLTAGSVVRITSPFGERIGSVTKASLGEYLIIDIEHSVDEGNYYGNKFRAIPSGVQSLPLPDVELAVAETQMARVTSNADPEGKGRVQVQMNWQTGDMYSDWIRGLTPDGGSSDSVENNRGMVFIPEVGDYVLVGFRHNDPNRPYIMGSLFNGKTGKGGGEGNNTKSITTKSGCALILNDAEGSVTLHNKVDGGNSSIEMRFDGDGNATLRASKSIKFTCGEFCIELHEDGSILINGKEVDMNATTRVAIGVGKGGNPDSGIQMNKDKLDITSKTTIVDGQNETIIGSSQGNTSVSASGEVKVGGSKVSLN